MRAQTLSAATSLAPSSKPLTSRPAPPSPLPEATAVPASKTSSSTNSSPSGAATLMSPAAFRIPIAATTPLSPPSWKTSTCSTSSPPAASSAACTPSIPRTRPKAASPCTAASLKIWPFAAILLKIDLDFALFEDIQTYEQAQAAYKSNDQFKKIASDPLQSGQVLPEQKCNGAFLCSLVKDGGIRLNAPGVKVSGHSIYVPGFGKVYFAEVMVSHGTRTLTMLRFEDGSTTGGGASGGSGTTNGKHYPPG